MLTAGHLGVDSVSVSETMLSTRMETELLSARACIVSSTEVFKVVGTERTLNLLVGGVPSASDIFFGLTRQLKC